MRIDQLFDEIASTRWRNDEATLVCRASPPASFSTREPERRGVAATRHGRATDESHALATLAVEQCGIDQKDLHEGGA